MSIFVQLTGEIKESCVLIFYNDLKNNALKEIKERIKKHYVKQKIKMKTYEKM